MNNKPLLQRIKAVLDAEENNKKVKKDNLTDIASEISNKPNEPQSNLSDNQAVAADGTVIDLTIEQQNTIKK